MDLNGRHFVKEYRNGWVLVPADFHADEWLATIKDRQGVIIGGRVPRNIKHHNKLFWILHKTFENLPDDIKTYVWPTEKALLRDLKDATGLGLDATAEGENPLTGAPRRAVASIAFESMDQAKFDAWYELALDVLAIRVLGCLPDELRREVEAMLAEAPPPRRRRHQEAAE